MYDSPSNSKASQKIWENISILAQTNKAKTTPYGSCYIICKLRNPFLIAGFIIKIIADIITSA